LLHVDAVSLVRFGLPVTRKLAFILAIWHTQEAIYLQLVGGCVQWWCRLAVKRCGYKLE